MVKFGEISLAILANFFFKSKFFNLVSLREYSSEILFFLTKFVNVELFFNYFFRLVTMFILNLKFNT